MVAFFLGNKVGGIMELCSLIPHPVVLAGGGLGIFSGLGDVSNIETSEENLLEAPGLGKGFLTPVLGFSRLREDDIKLSQQPKYIFYTKTCQANV